jgi:muramidase (phage lysozyme)
MAETDNVRKFLNFLGKAEGADYDVIVGHTPKNPKKFEDFSRHPGIVGLTTKDGPSTAAGRYQITKQTYDDFAPKLGITDFSPESQDKIALAIIQKQGALDDVRSGRFEDAIKKLGGRWASLPSSTYSQPKRSWEWAQKELQTPLSSSPGPQLQGRLTNPSGVVPSSSPAQSQLLMADLKKEQENDGVWNTIKNIPTAIQYGFQNENNAYNFIVEQRAGKIDPNFVMTKEKLQEYAKGLPEDYKPYLANAVSDDDAARRVARLTEAVQRQQEMANMGAGVSFFGTAVGTVLDVDTLLSLVPFVGKLGAARKGSRLANAVRGGLAAGAITGGSEFVFGQFRPTADEIDPYLAGLFGLTIGGAVGGLVKPGTVGKSAQEFMEDQQKFSNWADRQAGMIQQQEIKDAGLTVTELGKKVFDPDARNDALLDLDVQGVRGESPSVFSRTDVSNVDAVPTVGSKTPTERPAGSAKQVLSEIAESGTPEQKLVASRLMQQLPDDVNVYVVPKKDLVSGGRPYYDPNSHAIYISKTTDASTRLHEVAHAVTAHKLDFGAKNPETTIGRLTAQLNSLLKDARAKADADGFKSYYLKNIDEFVAGLYGGGKSRDKFVDFLSKMKTEDGSDNILGKFVDAVRKLLGMDGKETNAFLKSLDLADKLGDSRLNVTLSNQGKSGDIYPAGSKSIRLAEDTDPDFLPAKDTPEGFWQGPAYENFFNRDWVPDGVKKFARSIFGSTSGYKDHSVVAPAAMDQKRALTGQWQNQFAKTLKPTIQEFLEKKQIPFGKRSEALQQWNEDLGDYIRGVPGDYDPTVIKVGNEWRKLSKDVVDHINNPGKFNGDIKPGLTQREIIDEATGEKTLSDPLDYNDNYLPRIQDIHKEKSLIAQFGIETVERYIGNMFRSANSKISEELAEKLGRWYLKSVEDAKVNRASELVDNLLRGFDRVGFKDNLIRIGGISPQDADKIIAAMSKPAKGDDSGALSANLKRRSVLDETYTETVVMKDGTTATLSYKDLFDTDTVGMINNYFNKQAGAISLANHTGLYRVQDVKKTIAELGERTFTSDMTAEQQRKLIKHLEEIVDLTLGRPLEEFTTFNKSLQMVADYNILTKAGLFVLNQITEMAQLLGSPMFRSVLRTAPELGSLIRNTKTGKVSNEVVDALENLSAGPGTQLLRDNPLTPERQWVREKGDTAFNRWLDTGDNLLKRGTFNFFKYTGMTPVMMMQQRTLAVAFVNHMVDHAVNGKKIGYSPDRLAWMGLSDADTRAVMDGIKKYHTKSGNSRLGQVDFKQWSQDDPKSFSKFIVAYQRETARVIQENDLASMVPIMGRSVGQILFQFMGFPLHAWNKGMLFSWNHRDLATLNTVMWAIGFNVLAYVARTQMQMAGMSQEKAQEFADKRLAPEQIMLNAVGRIPQLSVLPNMFDTVSPVPLFSGMRTSTDMTDFITGNPTLSTISGALNMSKKLTRNAASDEYQTTEKDVKKWFQLMPLNNVMGVNQILNSVASDFPSNELVD